MYGVILISQFLPVGRAISDVLQLDDVSSEDEMYNQVIFLPLP